MLQRPYLFHPVTSVGLSFSLNVLGCCDRHAQAKGSALTVRSQPTGQVPLQVHRIGVTYQPACSTGPLKSSRGSAFAFLTWSEHIKCRRDRHELGAKLSGWSETGRVINPCCEGWPRRLARVCTRIWTLTNTGIWKDQVEKALRYTSHPITCSIFYKGVRLGQHTDNTRSDSFFESLQPSLIMAQNLQTQGPVPKFFKGYGECHPMYVVRMWRVPLTTRKFMLCQKNQSMPYDATGLQVTSKGTIQVQPRTFMGNLAS